VFKKPDLQNPAFLFQVEYSLFDARRVFLYNGVMSFPPLSVLFFLYALLSCGMPPYHRQMAQYLLAPC
jgi:hypothetical protein